MSGSTRNATIHHAARDGVGMAPRGSVGSNGGERLAPDAQASTRDASPRNELSDAVAASSLGCWRQSRPARHTNAGSSCRARRRRSSCCGDPLLCSAWGGLTASYARVQLEAFFGRREDRRGSRTQRSTAAIAPYKTRAQRAGSTPAADCESCRARRSADGSDGWTRGCPLS